RAEVALTIAAAVGWNGELDGFERAHFALRRVIGVNGMFKRQGIYRVHFLSRQGWGGRVLNHNTVAVALRQTARVDRIVVIVKHMEHLDESVFIRADLFV